MYAVSQFKLGDYDSAIDTFIELDINPAKVVALFPESISGRLYIPQDRWISLFGGPEPVHVDGGHGQPSTEEDAGNHAPERQSVPIGSVRGRLMTSLDAIMPSGTRDDDTASLAGTIKEKPVKEKPVGK